MERPLLWWRACMALLALWVAALTLAITLQWDTIPVAIGAIALFVGLTYLLEPRRAWWGPEVAAVIGDRAWMRSRFREWIVILIGTMIFVPIVVVFAVSAVTHR